MKQISKYILEKLYISKDYKVDKFCQGAKVSWGSDTAGYKLVDYIRTTAKESDILEFVDKYCTANRINWKNDLTNKKFGDSNKKFLKEYEYVIAFKPINVKDNDNSRTYVFFYNENQFKVEEINEKLYISKEYKVLSLLDEIIETVLVEKFWLDNEIEETKETVKEWIDMTKVKEVEYYMYSSDKRYIKDPITVGKKIPVNILNRIEENDSICKKIRKDAKLFHLVKSSGDVTVINILLSDNALIVTYQINGRSISFYILNVKSKSKIKSITEKLYIGKDYKAKNIETIEVYDFLNGGTHKFDLNVVYKDADNHLIIVKFPNGKFQDFCKNNENESVWTLFSDATNEEWPEEEWDGNGFNRPEWFTKDVLAREEDLDKYMPIGN